MSRQGLNAKLSYSINGQQYTFDYRCGNVLHGVRMVADESTSRTRRAYYPHRLSAAPFTIEALINGYNERVAFSNYLYDYTQRALDPGLDGRFPQMTVMVASRKFSRQGVPLDGIAWGTHVGAFVWRPRVTFETTMDTSLGDTADPSVSSFVLDSLATSRAPELKYFYPSGIQLGGDEVPPSGDYTKPVSPGDISAIINGGTSGGSDKGDALPNPWANKPMP